MDQDDVAHTHSGRRLSHKKEQNNAICSNMDGTRDSHTKQSISERERQTLHGITFMWHLKYDTGVPVVAQWLQTQGASKSVRV